MRNTEAILVILLIKSCVQSVCPNSPGYKVVQLDYIHTQHTILTKLFTMPSDYKYAKNTGAAASQCVTPRGVRQYWGLSGGGGLPPPPWLTQTLGVGGSGGQPPGSPWGGGGVGGYPNIHTSK